MKEKFEPLGIECRNCGSKRTIAHTSDELRKDHLLVWQCFDCDEFFDTGWDIEE